MNAKYKKTLKIVSLLITSIIIATGSVHAYSQLFMYGTITITDNRVILVAGTDTPTISNSGIENSGTTVNFDNINIAVDEILTYDDAVSIQNNAGSDKDIILDVTDVAGQFSANFDYIYITVNDTTTAQQGNQIKILPSGSNTTSTGTFSITNGETWTVQWIIKASVDATPAASIDITVQLTVQ
jgi:hypothetical protein